MYDLAAVALVGLVGSAHCAGMCGGFVALLGAGSRRGAVGRQAAYFLGKTATYTLFGALCGLAGVALSDLFGTLGGTISLVLGAIMVVFGLGLCGVAWRRSGSGSPIAARFGPAIGRLVGAGSPGAIALLGALNGLLPCGLVYGMLAVAAASGSATQGAATMAVFGLSTVPALALTGWLGTRLRPRRRVWMQRAAGLLIVAMGALTVARGATAFVPEAPDTPPAELCLPGR